MIDIVIVTYNRRKVLQQTLEAIWERTKMPYRLIVIDNNSTEDDTVDYLIDLKKRNKIQVLLLNDTNVHLARGYSSTVHFINSEYFVTTNDDLIPPDLEPDWLQQMIDRFGKYYPEYGALAMRCARIKNVRFGADWLPHKGEIGESPNALSAIYRMQKKSDIMKNREYFGTRIGYNDELTFKKIMNKMGFRTGYVADIWARHITFGIENKGYPEGFKNYVGYSEKRIKKKMRQGYPPVDPKTNKPLVDKF